MAIARRIIFGIVLIAEIISNAHASLKSKINSVELRLNYLEVRVNTDSIQTRSYLSSLEQSVASLNSSLAALNIVEDDGTGNRQILVDKDLKCSKVVEPQCERERQALVLGFVSEKKWIKDKMKTTEILFDTLEWETLNSIDEIRRAFEDQKIIFHEFANSTRHRAEEEKKNISILSAKVKNIELETLNSIDEIRRAFEEQKIIFHEFANSTRRRLEEEKKNISILSAKVKNIERKQNELETKQRENKNLIEGMQKENEKCREEINERLESFKVTADSKYVKNPFCPTNWKLFEGRCYYYSGSKKLSFNDARKYCRAMNADIADIENSRESEFIYSMTGHIYIWIGVTDEAEEGIWKSERTNKSVIYTYWRPKDPDGGTGQNCVVLGYGKPWHHWIDVGCTRSYRFVCKKNATENKQQ